MKRNMLVISLCCFVLFMGLAACNQKDSGPRVGVVDTEQVFKSSKLAQGGMDYVEGLSKGMEARFTEMQAALAADPENKELSEQFQAELMNMQGDFEAKQVEAATKLNNLFDAVLEEYCQKHKLDVIIPAQVVMAKSAAADVTAGVIQLMDSKTLDYGTEAPKSPEQGGAPVPAGAPAQ